MTQQETIWDKRRLVRCCPQNEPANRRECNTIKTQTMTAIQEYKWNNYVRKHPSCDKPALREIFIAGWNASHGVSETDAQKIEDWNKRQTTIDFDSI